MGRLTRVDAVEKGRILLSVVPLCELAAGIEVSIWIDFDAIWIDPMMSAFRRTIGAVGWTAALGFGARAF